MKLYLLFITTLFFSTSGKAESFLNNPVFWQDSRVENYQTFENEYSRVITATSLVPKSKRELARSINPYAPFVFMHHKSKVNGKVMFDVTYDLGEYGLRMIPATMTRPPLKHHLIIAGDSNTFGYGVNVADTLPVLLASKTQGLNPYNFAINGSGPHNILALMEFFPWEKLIKENKGIFIYNYYDFLLSRVIGDKNTIAFNQGASPWYELNEQGEAIYQGNLSQRFLSPVYGFIARVPWLNKMFPVLPRYTYQQTVLLSKIFLKMQKEYSKKFPKGRFIVALNYLPNEITPGRLKGLEYELYRNKIEFIVINEEKVQLPIYRYEDSHLNITGHRHEAALFLKVLSFNKIIR